MKPYGEMKCAAYSRLNYTRIVGRAGTVAGRKLMGHTLGLKQ